MLPYQSKLGKLPYYAKFDKLHKPVSSFIELFKSPPPTKPTTYAAVLRRGIWRAFSRGGRGGSRGGVCSPGVQLPGIELRDVAFAEEPRVFGIQRTPVEGLESESEAAVVTLEARAVEDESEGGLRPLLGVHGLAALGAGRVEARGSSSRLVGDVAGFEVERRELLEDSLVTRGHGVDADRAGEKEIRRVLLLHEILFDAVAADEEGEPLGRLVGRDGGREVAVLSAALHCSLTVRLTVTCTGSVLVVFWLLINHFYIDYLRLRHSLSGGVVLAGAGGAAHQRCIRRGGR